jgi:hypothetical protein
MEVTLTIPDSVASEIQMEVVCHFPAVCWNLRLSKRTKLN